MPDKSKTANEIMREFLRQNNAGIKIWSALAAISSGKGNEILVWLTPGDKLIEKERPN